MKIEVQKLNPKEYIDILDELHKKILCIAFEVKRICSKYNIKYFLIGGSLLGAVRHGGFIPWDDDMDIGLLRDDYNKFIDICKKELSTSFYLITAEEENYGLPYAKIAMKGTLLRESNSPFLTCGNGIFIDLFPIDRLPDNNYKRKVHKFKISLLRYLLLKKCRYPLVSKSKGIKKYIVDIYIKLTSKAVIKNALDRELSKYNKTCTRYYYNSGSAYEYGKEIFLAECLDGDLPLISFEGCYFPCPHNKEKVLELLYGDYMKLPPEEKRYNRHGIVEIDFGEEG